MYRSTKERKKEKREKENNLKGSKKERLQLTRLVKRARNRSIGTEISSYERRMCEGTQFLKY